MVFDHPFFAVTDADGSFEIEACQPANRISSSGRKKSVTWVLRTPQKAQGRVVTVRAGEVTDVGPIPIEPSQVK